MVLSSLIWAGDLQAETLAAKLDQMAKASATKIPPEKRAMMTEATEALSASGIVSRAPKVGESLPDATLLSVDGSETTLFKSLGSEATIVAFYRGEWCPYCNAQLQSYRDSAEEFAAVGAKVIAISPEMPDVAYGTKAKHELPFTVLSDRDNRFARKLGIVFEVVEPLRSVYRDFGIDLSKGQGNDSWELPLAATFVLDKTGKVHYAFVDVDYRKRAEPSDLIEAARKL